MGAASSIGSQLHLPRYTPHAWGRTSRRISYSAGTQKCGPTRQCPWEARHEMDIMRSTHTHKWRTRIHIYTTPPLVPADMGANYLFP